MILGRNLVPSNLLCSSCHTHSYIILVPRFSFDNVCHQIRRFSSTSRFDFDNVKNIITYSNFLPDDAVAVFQNTVMKLPRPTVFDLTKFLSAAVKMKQYSVALHLFEQLLQSGFFKRGCETAVVTLSAPIKCLLSVGRIDDAAKLLKKKLMDEKLGEPNEVMFYIDNLECYVI